MGASDVTAWAKNRLAEVAFLSVPAPVPAPPPTPFEPDQHGANTAPAPDQHGAETVPAPTRPKPLGWLHMEQPWRAADRLYQTHHWQCTTCKSAATGHAARCTDGQRLHTDYTQAAQAAMKGLT